MTFNLIKVIQQRRQIQAQQTVRNHNLHAYGKSLKKATGSRQEKI